MLSRCQNILLVKCIIYTGKGSDGKSLSEYKKTLSVPTQDVLPVCKPILGTNINVSADNWFTSIEVADELLKKKVTYVGTVKKDKKMIPQEFMPNGERDVCSTLYGFRGPFSLVSFVPKKNRAVVLLSTMHLSVQQNQEKIARSNLFLQYHEMWRRYSRHEMCGVFV